MAREKMLEPAFLKAFTEAINKEDKIRSLNYLEDVGNVPRTARVDFGADFSSDESEVEEYGSTEVPGKTSSDLCDSCGREVDGDKSKTEEQTKLSQKQSTKKSPKRTKKRPMTTKAEKDVKFGYIFPICNFCDFGWDYRSRNFVVCPLHGPFRRTRMGYSPAIRDYLKDQLHRDALSSDSKHRSRLKELTNKHYV